jgi:hypothetical protein
MHFKIFPWGISVKFAMLLIFGKYINGTRLKSNMKGKYCGIFGLNIFT